MHKRINRGGSLTVLLTLIFCAISVQGELFNPSLLARRKVNLGLSGLELNDGNIVPAEIPATKSIWAEKMNVMVEGFTMTTIHDTEIYAFQGIRYAEKPARFQPPDLIKAEYYLDENQDGILKANHLPEKCPQSGFLDSSLAVGTEDCLFLNVYTPQLQDDENEYAEFLPVMVFIHGGGFTSGDTSLYMPTRLLDKPVILVTIQYRLGSFGFFSTGDSQAKGNAGLYDQQTAMKWVQEFISDFGGDETKVTIFGQSAGSASVTHQLLSKSSSGLFKGVIAESGSALDYWAIDPDPVASATAIAEVNGCEGDTQDMTNVYNCMLGLSMEELVWGISELQEQDYASGTLGFRGTSPIVQDFLTEEENPIIYYPPEEVFHNGDFNTDVALMIGANRDEGSFVFGIMYTAYLVPNQLVNDSLFIQEDMIPTMLGSFGIDDKTHALSESLALEYLGNVNRSSLEEVTPGMIDMSGVIFEKGGVYECAKYHSLGKDEGVGTFFYSFDYLSDDSMFDWLFMGSPYPPPFEHGVTHSDELMYIFSLPADQDDEEKRINDMMVELWTNFATYTHPTPEERKETLEEYSIEYWEEFDIQNQNFMVMESTFHVEQEYTSRWTINTEGVPDPDSGFTTLEPGPTENPCASIEQLYNQLSDDYDDLDKTKNIYMGLMISFIVLFVLEACACGYLFYKLYYA